MHLGAAEVSWLVECPLCNFKDLSLTPSVKGWHAHLVPIQSETSRSLGLFASQPSLIGETQTPERGDQEEGEGEGLRLCLKKQDG